MNDLVHTTADGRRFLILHGDGFDVVSQHANWLWHLGARVYSVLQRVNQRFNAAVYGGVRRRLRVSGFLKHCLKRSVNMIGRYEAKLVREARRHGVDGIICGHIHRAELRDIAGITYGNSGDWVESCTALVEHHDGTLTLVNSGHPAGQKPVTAGRHGQTFLQPNPKDSTMIEQAGRGAPIAEPDRTDRVAPGRAAR